MIPYKYVTVEWYSGHKIVRLLFDYHCKPLDGPKVIEYYINIFLLKNFGVYCILIIKIDKILKLLSKKFEFEFLWRLWNLGKITKHFTI